VPDLEFFFALDVSDEASFDVMLNQVAAAVLGYAGCSGERLTALAASFRAELTAAAGAGRRCHVQFRAHAGQLRITVSCAGRPDWHTTHAFPPE
jgi:hypothetical protein